MAHIVRTLGDKIVHANGISRPCCMPENMTKPEDGGSQGTLVRRCITCGARHYEMNAEAGQLFAKYVG
jgi:hypothetical protein